MITYQDLVAVGSNERDRAAFVRRVVSENQASEMYRTARIADDYDRCRNTTAMQYQKMIVDIYGRRHVDTTATVHRSTSNFFYIFTSQLNQYLLGNGISWGDPKSKEALGLDFDTRVQQAGKAALVGGCAFGFWNFDHLEVFPLYSKSGGEFAPIYDEETGGLTSGVRSWQVSAGKPLRATLYEMDGYTDYMWTTSLFVSDSWEKLDEGTYYKRKRPYKLHMIHTEADGDEILAGENYPSFPIVPLWANRHGQSELVGMREKIDAYDFVLNGWEDDLDNAQIYWLIKGAGGMDDPDLAQFLDRLRNAKAAAPMDGQDVEPVTVEIPVAARNELLTRLEKQLYRDAMIMDPDQIAGGAVTATQIEAGYERQNVKADEFEYCILEFLAGIMRVAGIEDTPTLRRSVVVNKAEEIQTLMLASTSLSQEYVTRRILTLLGDGDMADEVVKAMDAEALDRIGGLTT